MNDEPTEGKDSTEDGNTKPVFDDQPQSFGVQVEDDIEALRVQQDLQYARNRSALGKPTVALAARYSGLYGDFMKLAGTRMPLPIRHEVLFSQEMLMECRAELIRSMLLLMRGHISDAHAQTRRAIECCVWARRIRREKPELVDEWLKLDPNTPPTKVWRDNMGAKSLFPPLVPGLLELRHRYQITSRCLHPFRDSFKGRLTPKQHKDGRFSVVYDFFEDEESRQFIPTHFLWTIQTHDFILDVFQEEVFLEELEGVNEHWTERRSAAKKYQAEIGRFWIELNQRANRSAPHSAA